jgi:hypothetical protein
MATSEDHTLDDLSSRWRGLVDQAPADAATKALFGRGNLRVNVAEALKAAFYTAKVYIEGKVALATGNITPWELAKLVKGGIDAVTATLRAFYETLTEAEYVTALVLSQAEDGLTRANLESEVLDFVRRAEHKEFPLFLGLSSSFVTNAKTVLETPGAFDTVLAGLRKRSLLLEDNALLRFTSKHFEWGLKLV